MPLAKKIILDTNFAMIPADLGIDVFAEIDVICDFPYELFILEKSEKELEKIQERGGEHGRAAKLALSLIESKNVKTLQDESDEYVDDVLVRLSDEYIVATQDSELKKRLKGKKIFLRQKKYVVLE